MSYARYTVKVGDTLEEIAQEHLHGKAFYTAILDEEYKHIIDPDDIKVGQVLQIPHLVLFVNDAVYDSEHVTDITCPEGTVVAGGEKFVKVWRIKNTGNAPWLWGFVLAFEKGEKMEAFDQVYVPNVVAPGDDVDIAVDFIAPWQRGTHTCWWQLRTPSGERFGTLVHVKIGVGL